MITVHEAQGAHRNAVCVIIIAKSITWALCSQRSFPLPLQNNNSTYRHILGPQISIATFESATPLPVISRWVVTDGLQCSHFPSPGSSRGLPVGCPGSTERNKNPVTSWPTLYISYSIHPAVARRCTHSVEAVSWVHSSLPTPMFCDFQLQAVGCGAASRME